MLRRRCNGAALNLRNGGHLKDRSTSKISTAITSRTFSLHEALSDDGELRLYLHPTVFDVRYVPYINPPKASPTRYRLDDILETAEASLRLYKEMVEFAIEIGAVLPSPEAS